MTPKGKALGKVKEKKFGTPYGIKEKMNIAPEYHKKHGQKFVSHYMSHTRDK